MNEIIKSKFALNNQHPPLDVIIETILFAANEPLSINKIKDSLSQKYDTLAIQEAIENLVERWHSRGLELINSPEGYRFRTKLSMQLFVEQSQLNRFPKYSRSVLETLAIIAYRQPITRAEIEKIRGITINTSAIKTLEIRGWIEVVGVKKSSPGHPQLLATTNKFLADLGLKSLAELPPLEVIAETLEHNIDENSKQSTLPIENDTKESLTSTTSRQNDTNSSIP